MVQMAGTARPTCLCLLPCAFFGQFESIISFTILSIVELLAAGLFVRMENARCLPDFVLQYPLRVFTELIYPVLAKTLPLYFLLLKRLFFFKVPLSELASESRYIFAALWLAIYLKTVVKHFAEILLLWLSPEPSSIIYCSESMPILLRNAATAACPVFHEPSQICPPGCWAAW